MTSKERKTDNTPEQNPFAHVLHGHADWLSNHPDNRCNNQRGWNAGFGFECGQGWSGLLEKLFNDLSQILRPRGDQIEIRQIKEKFGTLRVYWAGAVDNHTDALIEDAILLATFRSEVTCDVCGDSGQMRRNGFGYYHVACNVHSKSDDRVVAGGVIGRISDNQSAGQYSETIYDPALDMMTRRMLSRFEYEALTKQSAKGSTTTTSTGDGT
jgi:hypothetical protein